MTTYIERIVTEVVVKPTATEDGGETDKRWVEQQQIEAAIKSHHRQEERLRAVGLDD